MVTGSRILSTDGYHSKGVRPPSFCKAKKYKSFTLKQAGYKLLRDKIRLGKYTYGYHKSREIEGKIKTLTVKRVPSGDLYIFIVTDAKSEKYAPVTGKIAGFDFGLKTFLTNSNGCDIESPLYLLQAKKQLKKISQQLSSKKLGSRNGHKARIKLAKMHERVANLRRNFFWETANKLCDTYDVMCFETLKSSYPTADVEDLEGFTSSHLMELFPVIIELNLNAKGSK